MKSTEKDATFTSDWVSCDISDAGVEKCGDRPCKSSVSFGGRPFEIQCFLRGQTLRK